MGSFPIAIDVNVPANYSVNRAIAILSDGKVAALVVQNHSGGVGNIHVLAEARTSQTTSAVIGFAASYYSMTVGPDDALHILYTEKNTQNLRYVKATRSGDTYTFGTARLISTPSGSNYYGRRDIEVLDSGVLVVIAHMMLPAASPNDVHTKIWTSVNDGANWSNVWNDNTAMVDLHAGVDQVCSIARDAGGASGGYQRIAYAYQRNGRSYSMRMGTMRVEIATGVIDDVQQRLAVPNEVKYYGIQGHVFSTGSNEWCFAGSLGHVNSATAGQKLLAYKFSKDAILGQATPALNPDVNSGTDPASTFQAFGAMSTGRLVAFSSLFTGVAGTTGVRANVCIIEGNTLKWGPPMAFSKNVGHVFVRSGGNRNLSARWVDVISARVSDEVTFFSRVDVPSTPTGVTPFAGATVTTARPPVTLAQAGSQGRVLGEWTLAADASFTTAVKNIAEPTSDLRTSGIASETVSAAHALTQSTWYIRGRSVSEFGVASNWTANHSFTVSHPPRAETSNPVNGGTVSSEGYFLTWRFLDTYADDQQTAYQVVVTLAADGTIILDTGKVVSSEKVHTIGGPIVTNLGELLQWKVRVWDGEDVSGPYSATTDFIVAQPPSVAITEPEDNEVLEGPAPLVAWTFTPGQTSQSDFLVEILDAPGATVLHSFREFRTEATEFTVPIPVFENNKNYIVRVTVYDQLGLSATDSAVVSTQWISPEYPPFTIDIQRYSGEGYVEVIWNDQVQDEDSAGYRVYRRLLGQPDTAEMVYESTEVLQSYNFHDWLAPSGLTSEWAVVQLATRFGVIVESDKFWDQATPNDDYYWLIHPTDESYSMRLTNVTAHDFTPAYEQEEMTVIGRGRHFDRGTFLGDSGSITAQVWDWQNMTAREIRLKVNLLREMTTAFWLRDPFGDVKKVVPGDIGFSRMAGVGQRDFGTLTIPYGETYE